MASSLILPVRTSSSKIIAMKKPRRRQYLWSFFILWLAYGLRLYRIDFQSIWWDEGHSIFVASHPISQIPTLPAMDVHPPAYFALLHLWTTIAGRSEFALRYLSVIFSLLTVALLWRFAASIFRYLHPRSLAPRLPCTFAPILASLLAALSPMYIAYGQEVRSYAMITFLALGSTFALWQITFRIPTPLFRWLLVYTLLTVACLYTHYFTIFLLLFQNLVWLAWVLMPSQISTTSPFWISRLSRLILWAFSQLAILLLFTPQFMLAMQQITSYTNPNLLPPTLTYFISHSWQAYTVGLTIDPAPAQWGMWGIAGIVAMSWLIQLITKQVRLSPDFSRLISNFLFLVSWFLIPLAAYFIVLQRQPSFEPRYMMFITPALFLLLALGLSQIPPITHYGLRIKPSALPRPASRFTHYVLPLIPLAIFLMGAYSYYTNQTYFKDDSAGVAGWLAAETTANDIVYIDVPHPFHYYAERRNIPAPTRYLFVDIHTAAETLAQEATGRDRLFWVTWRGSDTDPRGVIPFLAEKAGQKSGQLDFKGYQVQWFNLPAESKTTFSLPNTLTPINATFGDTVRLDGLAFGGVENSTTTPINEPAWATLHFTLLQETNVNYKVSLRLRGEDGRLAAQLDRDLLNDRHFRTSAWPLDNPALNQAINVYTLPLAPNTPPGLYRLEAVIYNADPPYPSEGVTGHENIDGVAAVLGYISVIP